MTGINNGVHKVLKEECGLKELVLTCCVCHSLHLAVSHASKDTVPRSVEYLVISSKAQGVLQGHI